MRKYIYLLLLLFAKQALLAQTCKIDAGADLLLNCGETAQIDAKSVSWNKLSKPSAGSFYSLHFFDNNKAIAVSDSGNIYRTADMGANWSKLNSKTSNNLRHICFTDANTGYIAGSKGTVLKSTDAGSSWSLLNTSISDDLFSCSFISKDTGFVVGRFGTILRTYNGGTNWTSLNTGTYSDMYAVYFVNKNLGFAAGKYGTIIRTTDGGKTWLNFASNTVSNLNSITFIDNNTGFAVGKNGAITKTINGGLSWFLVQPLNCTDVFCIRFVDKLHGFIACSEGKFFQSSDAGLSWQPLSTGTNINLYSISALNISTVFLSGEHGNFLKYSSTQFAKYNWTPSTALSNNAVSNPLAAPKATTSYIIEATTSDGCIARDTVLLRVNPIFKINSNVPAVVCGQSVQLSSSPVDFMRILSPAVNNINSVYFKDASNAFAVGAFGSVIKTQDAGVNWSVVNTGLYTSFNSVAFADSQYGIIAGEKGVALITADGGQNWNKIVLPTLLNLNSVFIINKTAYIAGDSGLVFKAQIPYNKWSKSFAGLDKSLYAVFFTDDNTGYASGGEGVIYKTTDAGLSWTLKTSNSLSWLYSIFFTTKTNGYIAGSGGAILTTVDAGATWTKQSLWYNFKAIRFINKDTGFAVGSSGVILKTFDNGFSWDAEIYSPAYNFNAISNLNNNIILFGDEAAILKYDPVKIKWTPTLGLNADNIKNPIAAPDVSTYYTVTVTSDLGCTTTASLDIPIQPIITLESNLTVSCPSSVQLQPKVQTWITRSVNSKVNLLTTNVVDKDNIYIAGEQATVLRTSNGGKTWDKSKVVNSNLRLNSICFTDKNTGYIAADSGRIFKTIDAGINWSVLNTNRTTNLFSICFPNPSTGFVTGNDRLIMKTIDAGLHWDTLNTGINDNSDIGYFSSIEFSDALTGVAVGDIGSVIKTFDGGTTWYLYASNMYSETYNSVDFVDNKNGFAVGYDTDFEQSIVLNTLNGGKTWAINTIGGVGEVMKSIHCIDINNIYIVGTNGSIYISNDSGVTWTKALSGTNEDLNAVYFSDANTGFAVGTNGTIIRFPYFDFKWSPATGLSSDNIINPQASPLSTTKYTLVASNDYLRCSPTTLSVNVNVIKPDYKLSFNSDYQNFIKTPFLANFYNQTAASANYNFIWNFGDGTTLSSNSTAVSHEFKFNGTYTVTLIASNKTTSCADTLIKAKYIKCSGGADLLYKIEGIVKYDNQTALKLLPNVRLAVYTSSGMLVKQTKSDNNGYYRFDSLVSGSYNIIASDTTGIWGGADPLDALMINRYYIGFSTFGDMLQTQASDVNNDKNTDPLDALFVNRRYIGSVISFASGDWLFENPAVIIDNKNILQDIKGICFGDVNSDFAN